MRARGCFTLLMIMFALIGAACGNDTSPDPTGDRARTNGDQSATDEPTATATGVTGEITVFAAASLTGAFTEMGSAFEARNPEAKVTFNFGASSSLARQIAEGAPVDVFASADQANMEKLIDAGDVPGEPAVFATNNLQIITGAGNPKGITGIADLADPDLIVVTCGEDVPIGRYTAEVFSKANVDVTPRSYEADVKAIVNKVTAGEADAGVVYATDVKAAGDKAVGVGIPDDLNTIATYPIAVTKAANNVDTADAFVAFVLSDEGQKILSAAGFTAS